MDISLSSALPALVLLLKATLPPRRRPRGLGSCCSAHPPARGISCGSSRSRAAARCRSSPRGRRCRCGFCRSDVPAIGHAPLRCRVRCTLDGVDAPVTAVAPPPDVYRTHGFRPLARTERPPASPLGSLGTPMLAAAWAVVALALAAPPRVWRMVSPPHRRPRAPARRPAWQTPLYEIADRLGLDAAPRLLRSDDVKMPFAGGLLSSTIVLPAESESWSAERRTRRADPRAGSRAPPRPDRPHARPHRLRALLVPSARVDRGTPPPRRERARVRRSRARLRRAAERLRRAPARHRDLRPRPQHTRGRARDGAPQGIRGTHARHPRIRSSGAADSAACSRPRWLAGLRRWRSSWALPRRCHAPAEHVAQVQAIGLDDDLDRPLARPKR